MPIQRLNVLVSCSYLDANQVVVKITQQFEIDRLGFPVLFITVRRKEIAFPHTLRRRNDVI